MITKLNSIHLQEGDVLHCTSNGWLAKLIKFFTRSKINHTAIILKIGHHFFVADAQINGVNLKTIDEWNNKYNYQYIISRPKKFTSKNFNRALDKCGITGYDFASLLFQAWYQVTGRWVGKTKERAEKRMYCSEYVAYVLDLDKWWMKSPKDVYNTLIKSNDFITIKY